MAGKHQIWSSSKATRRKANRCWRRQNKLRLQAAALRAEPAVLSGPVDVEALKRGPLVYGGDPGFGTPLGSLIAAAVAEDKQMTVSEFAAMLHKWNECTAEQFAALLPEIRSAERAQQFQRFCATPLEYFLSLNLDQQHRMVTWLRASTPAA